MTQFEYRGALNPDDHRDIIVPRPELDRIQTHIANADLYIALRSPRQTGKTTLLFQLQANLHGHGYGAAYVDLYNVPRNLDIELR